MAKKFKDNGLLDPNEIGTSERITTPTKTVANKPKKGKNVGTNLVKAVTSISNSFSCLGSTQIPAAIVAFGEGVASRSGFV